MIDVNKYDLTNPDDIRTCIQDLVKALNNQQSGKVSFLDKSITKDDVTNIEEGQIVIGGRDNVIATKINGNLKIVNLNDL